MVESITLVNKMPGITIEGLIAFNPELFYSQSWYFGHRFMREPLAQGEYVFSTNTLIKPQLIQPRAVELVWAYVHMKTFHGITLWPDGYVWASNSDDNKDALYVGGSELNKPGLEIHRFLSGKLNRYIDFSYKA